jgi:hypothetical protein
MARGTGLDAHRQDRRRQTSGTRAERLTPARGGLGDSALRMIARVCGGSAPLRLPASCSRVPIQSFPASAAVRWRTGARVGPDEGGSHGVPVIGFSGREPKTPHRKARASSLSRGPSIRRTPGIGTQTTERRRSRGRFPPVITMACRALRASCNGFPSVAEGSGSCCGRVRLAGYHFQLCTRSDISTLRGH